MTDAKQTALDLEVIESISQIPNFRWLSTGTAMNKLTRQRYDLEDDECRAFSVNFAQKRPAKAGQLVDIGKALCLAPSLARLAISQQSSIAELKARCGQPPQSVGHDELVERLRGIETHINTYYSETMMEDEHLSALAAAITALSRQPAQDWVKIEDIPDEWKDGRLLQALNQDMHNGVVWWGRDDVFKDDRFLGNMFDERGNVYDASNQNIRFLMLPIAPPKTD